MGLVPLGQREERVVERAHIIGRTRSGMKLGESKRESTIENARSKGKRHLQRRLDLDKISKVN